MSQEELHNQGHWVVQWYQEGEWRKENWRWNQHGSAMKHAAVMMDNGAEAAIVERIKPRHWGSITHDHIFEYQATMSDGRLYTSDLYVDWDREEKRARIRHKQLKKIKLG